MALSARFFFHFVRRPPLSATCPWPREATVIGQVVLTGRRKPPELFYTPIDKSSIDKDTFAKPRAFCQSVLPIFPRQPRARTTRGKRVSPPPTDGIPARGRMSGKTRPMGKKTTETKMIRGALVMSYPFNERTHPDCSRKFPAALKSNAQLFFLGSGSPGR